MLVVYLFFDFMFWLFGSCHDLEFPFEFRALEVALEGICSFLDARTRELETDAYPALDELTSKVKDFLRVSLFFICSADFVCWMN